MVYNLMDHTLPTIVGMGVVSRTTETMFGKGKRARGRRAKMIKRASKSAANPSRPKTFLYRGRRYNIVYKTAGGSRDALIAVRDAQKHMYGGLGVVKKTSDGRYALGLRVGITGY